MTTHKEALEAAYLAGFNASGEGYNGEYPFGDKMQDPAENRVWKKDRDNYIKEALAQQCVCGEPNSAGTHRTDGPCLAPQPKQEPTNLERHERNVQKFLGTQQPKEPEQDEYLSKAYRLANELRCHLSIAPAPQRTWVGLTHSDIDQGLLRSDYALKTAEAWRAGVVFAMTKLKEKNNG